MNFSIWKKARNLKFMYKKIIKTKNMSYDDISRKYFGTPYKAGDILKLNNNIEEGEVLVYIEDDILEEETSKTSLTIEEQTFTFFPEYSLIDNLNAINGAVFIINKENSNFNFKIGQQAQIKEQNNKFLNGRISNVKNCFNKTANWQQVEIKSHAGILLDSNLPYPLTFINSSIKNILTSIAELFGQKITFSNEKELEEVFVNEIGMSYTASILENAFDFMNRICISRGLLLTDTGDGLFVGRYNPDTQEKINLISSECIGLDSMFWEATGDGLARYYEINSQYPEFSSATVQIPFPLPIIKRFNSNDFNAKDLPTIGNNLVCREIGKHFKLTAVLNENYEIKSGSFAIVKNPDVGIDEETEFVVNSVYRKHPNQTVLQMTLPCAYTYQLPEKLPLCC